MNGHAPNNSSLAYEENVYLLDEKCLSDLDSEAGRSEHSDCSSPSSTHSTTPTISEWAHLGKRIASAAMPPPPTLPSRSHLRSLAVRAALFLLPSFVSHRYHHHHHHQYEPARLSPTAYLDGMRGLAAFIVFFCHYFYSSFEIAEGWGSNDRNYTLFKLPFFRLVYAGPPMVAIFFVVSGYALSLKPLKLARARRWAEFSQTMSSFAFRRAFRLLLPTAISTFMIVILLQLGAYEWNREFSHDRTYHWNVQETAPDLKPTFTEQLVDWGWNMFNFVHVWGWEKYGGSTYYDVHLWTIPIEFRASMVLFLTATALARLRTSLRFLFLGVCMVFTYRSDRWEMLLFFVGMLFAELDLIRGAHTDPSTCAALQDNDNTDVLPTAEPKTPTMLSYVGTGGLSTQQPPKASMLSRAAWALLATISLYLLSQPDANSENTPGWRTLSALIPAWVDDKYRYWQCVGAALFVFCVARMPTLQRVFNSSPIQYLGKISYAIYLMHGPVMHTIGYALERWSWGLTGTETAARYRMGFALASVGVIPCVVWAADVFWRAVDAPVVRLAKWLEGKCVVKEETGTQRR